MSNPSQKAGWDIWWPRILSLAGLTIVVFIVVEGSHLDPYVYPLIALMLGFPIAGILDAAVRKKGNGNGNTH